MRMCSVDDCNKKHEAKGYCQGHYRRLRCYGDVFVNIPLGKLPRPKKESKRNICSVKNCNNVVVSHGLCTAHHKRFKKHGDAQADKPIRQQHEGCLVEGCDRAAKSRGYCSTHYYRVKRYGDAQAHIPIRKAKYDLVGQKFGRLTVLRKLEETNKHNSSLWECSCSCGNTRIVPTPGLMTGDTKSCGCLWKEKNDVDMTGKIFGRLTVLEKAGHDKHKHVLWKCLCTCGNTIYRSGIKLRENNKLYSVQSCGCYNTERMIKIGKESAAELVGKCFGKLIVLEKTEKRTKRGGVIWRCKCDCGNDTLISSTALIQGTISCGCETHSEETIKKRTNSTIKTCMKKYKKGQAGKSRLLGMYKASARNRKIEWNLSKEDFYKLTKQNCFYCGKLPTKETYTYCNTQEYDEYSKYKYNGIDRVDSSKGYSKSNCVPCCTQCNRAKLDHSLTNFTEWVVRTYNHIEPMLAPGYEQKILNKAKEEKVTTL